jgi:anti-sigma factor RsiW
MSPSEIQSCEEALRLLAAHIDRELDAPTSGRVARHLETCRSCFSRAEFEKRLKQDLTGLGREPVRPALADRVRALIRTFDAAGRE